MNLLSVYLLVGGMVCVTVVALKLLQLGCDGYEVSIQREGDTPDTPEPTGKEGKVPLDYFRRQLARHPRNTVIGAIWFVLAMLMFLAGTILGLT